MVGTGELKKLFTIENYICEKQCLELYYPERFLNILEQRALIKRMENAQNYSEVRIITSSPYIIQCVSSKNLKIANVKDEDLSEDIFKMSFNEVGMPYDGGLGVF
jgi:hypothetical protein